MSYMVSIIYIICTKKYNIKYIRVCNVRIGPSDVQAFYNKEPSTCTKNASTVDLSTINFSEETSAGKMFDELIRYEMKNDGRKAKYEKQLLDSNDKEKKVNKLKDLTRISSGELAAANHFMLDDDIMMLVQNKTRVEDQKGKKSVIVNENEKMTLKKSISKPSKNCNNNNNYLPPTIKY